MSNSFDSIIRRLSKLPGLGTRSARRLMFHLLNDKNKNLEPLMSILETLRDEVTICVQCNNIMLDSSLRDICNICSNPSRDVSILCVVEQIADLWAMERAGEYNGVYYILGGTLSTINGVGPDDLKISDMIALIKSKNNLQEIIIATSMTANGQTTAHYIAHLIRELEIKVSRISPGVPMGGELDYLDNGTLNAALASRHNF